MREKCFRVGDGVGPDYVCGKCGKAGHRLWRETNVFLNGVDLRCAECAETQEADAIKRYSDFHQPTDPAIGNLVPARPTPEGDTFWGHTSGDIAWWYRLPQWTDSTRELQQARLERDHFVSKEQYAIKDWLEARQELRELRNAMRTKGNELVDLSQKK